MCKFSIGQKLVQTYYDWNKIHPKEVYYVNTAGQKTGAYKLYNENGVVIKEYTYLNGQENGLCIDYAATGANLRVVAAKGSFINGQPDGSYVQFCDEDGYKSKVQEGRYKNGKKTGKWKEWWCNEIYDNKYVGILKSVGVYKNGERDSVWSFYNNKGKIEKTVRFADGVQAREGIMYIYNKNGTLISYGPYVGDEAEGDGPNGLKKNGVWHDYYDDGSISSISSFNYGHGWGTWSFYMPGDSAKPANTGQYIYDRYFGDWKFYFDKDLDSYFIPNHAVYYRLISFDSSGTPVGNARDYNISGEKVWEGPVSTDDALVFKKH